MTFCEVAEALNYLSDRTNHAADIIPGVIVNEGLGEKVQVILVITGLGATAVDHKGSEKKDQIQPPVNIAQPPASQLQPPAPAVAPKVEMVAGQVDLDIPAFIRRRLR